MKDGDRMFGEAKIAAILSNDGIERKAREIQGLRLVLADDAGNVLFSWETGADEDVFAVLAETRCPISGIPVIGKEAAAKIGQFLLDQM
jgi:hypothetical protein